MTIFNAGSVGFLALGVAIGISLSKVGGGGGGGGGRGSEPSAHGTHYPGDVLVALDRSAKAGGGGCDSSSADEARHSPGAAVPMDPGRSAAPRVPFVEEYIPASLRSKYDQSRLQFNVTRSMLRRSRPVVGNTERLHAYLRKLRAGQCTTVLVLGGSVSDGHHVPGKDKNAYPQNFVEWLNERYPCRSQNGTAGTHERKKIEGASNSQTHMTSWSTVEAIERFDLVLLEFNVNDYFISDLPHRLEDKGPVGDTKEYISAWYFEVILRRILLVRKPDPPAVVTFNADYRGRIWAGPDRPRWTDPEKARKTLFRQNQEPVKNWLSSLYEIPVFSAAIWMLPLAGKRGDSMQFNTTNPYATTNWHSDPCCHPRLEGHLILSLVLAYCMVEEEKVMLSGDGDDAAYEETDFTAGDVPTLRTPVYLSPEEDALYVHNSVAHAGVDFTHSNKGEQEWKDVVVANEGWTWYADNREKDKFGYIANDVAGGQHMAISVTGGRHGVVEISYVISYENFGTALAWFDNSTENDFRAQCNKTVDKKKQGKRGGATPLIAIWTEKASVPKVELIKNKLDEGETSILHICLTPRSNKIAVGSENKFKLLGVRLY